MFPVVCSQTSTLGRQMTLELAEGKEPDLWKEAVGRDGMQS